MNTMDNPEEFIELANSVCRRPRMYTVNGTFGEVAAFFTGIAAGSTSSPISDFGALNFFVTARLLVPSKFSWPSAILTVAADDDDAINRLRELLVEFATLRKTQSFDQIRSDAASRLSDYRKSKPATVWRQFLAARYRAIQAEIEPLIMPHPNASVLWRHDPTPPDVAAQLTAISDSFVVSVLSGSEESGHVRLLTELGVFDAHFIDGNWRIDASSIIDIDAKQA